MCVGIAPGISRLRLCSHPFWMWLGTVFSKVTSKFKKNKNNEILVLHYQCDHHPFQGPYDANIVDSCGERERHLKRKMKDLRVNTALNHMEYELKVGRRKFKSCVQVQTVGRASIKPIHMKMKRIFMQYSPKLLCDQVRKGCKHRLVGRGEVGWREMAHRILLESTAVSHCTTF